jgi:hypothetical protein
MNASNFKVFKIPITSKRLQVYKAIPFVKTYIIIIANNNII